MVPCAERGNLPNGACKGSGITAIIMQYHNSDPSSCNGSAHIGAQCASAEEAQQHAWSEVLRGYAQATVYASAGCGHDGAATYFEGGDYAPNAHSHPPAMSFPQQDGSGGDLHSQQTRYFEGTHVPVDGTLFLMTKQRCLITWNGTDTLNPFVFVTLPTKKTNTGWFQSCRGCGAWTGETQYQADGSELPMCRRCQAKSRGSSASSGASSRGMSPASTTGGAGGLFANVPQSQGNRRMSCSDLLNLNDAATMMQQMLETPVHSAGDISGLDAVTACSGDDDARTTAPLSNLPSPSTTQEDLPTAIGRRPSEGVKRAALEGAAPSPARHRRRKRALVRDE